MDDEGFITDLMRNGWFNPIDLFVLIGIAYCIWNILTGG